MAKLEKTPKARQKEWTQEQLAKELFNVRAMTVRRWKKAHKLSAKNERTARAVFKEFRVKG